MFSRLDVNVHSFPQPAEELMLWSHKADLSGNYKTFLTYSHFPFH